MKNKFSLLEKAEKLAYIIPVEDYFSQMVIAPESPFLPVSFLARMKILLMNGWLWLTEKIIGSKLFVENDLRELFFIDSRIRSALLLLLNKKIVSSWSQMENFPDLPPVIRFLIKLNPSNAQSKRIAHTERQGGEGVGYTPHQSLIPALAETLERYSMIVWNEKRIFNGSFDSLCSQNAVNPALFSFFSENQLSMSRFAKSIITSQTEIGWIVARSFFTKKKYLIPAQLVYMTYSLEHRDQPYFFQETTNGVAAGVSFDSATYRALCEAIERDGLLIFWLNKIAPPLIDLSSIPYPRVQEYIEKIRQYKLEIFILDITTDLLIPSFCAVLIDRFGERMVSMSAVADFNIQSAFEKLMLEVLKFPHCRWENNKKNYQIGEERQYLDIQTFEERQFFWSKRENISQIEFFLQGKKKNFAEIDMEYSSKSIKEKLSRIKDIFKEKKYNCFLSDISSAEARQLGLFVIKAVVPQLVPAYFREKEKPLGVKRLYAVPVTLGYLSESFAEDELNSIPHPFL